MTRMLLTAVAVGVLGAPAAAKDTGNRSTLLFIRFSGAAPYRGQDVKYMYIVTRSAAQPDSAPGSMLAIIPPIDIERGADGELDVTVSDPEYLDEFRLKKSDGTEVACTAKELAAAYGRRELKPDAPVLVTLKLRLHCDEDLKRQVLYAARVQMLKRIEERDIALADGYRSGDFERAAKSIILLPAKEILIVATTPGLESVSFRVTNNPSLGETLTVQAKVPAKFVASLYSKAGTRFAAKFIYDAYGNDRTELTARRVADDFVSNFVKDYGKGGLKYDKAGGTAGQIEILASRDQVQNYTRESKWKDNLHVSGANDDDINFLAELFQRRGDQDVFAVNQNEVDAWAKRQFDGMEALREKGYAEALEEAANKEKLTDEDVASFRSKVATYNNRKSSGGGGSFLGLVSWGGGGGVDIATGSAIKEEDRRHQHEFLRSLSTFRKLGKFPIPPSLDLRLVSHQKLRKEVDSRYTFDRAGKVAEQEPLTSLFGSAAPTLKAQTGASESYTPLAKAEADAEERLGRAKLKAKVAQDEANALLELLDRGKPKPQQK